MLGDTRHRSQLLELIEVLDPEPDQYAGRLADADAQSFCLRLLLAGYFEIVSTVHVYIQANASKCTTSHTSEHRALAGVQKWSDLGYLNHVAREAFGTCGVGTTS